MIRKLPVLLLFVSACAYEPPVKSYSELGAELVQSQRRVRELELMYDGDVNRSLNILRRVPSLKEEGLEARVSEAVDRLEAAEERCGVLDAPGLHTFSDGCNTCELLGLYEDDKAMLVRCTLRFCEDDGKFSFTPEEDSL